MFTMMNQLIPMNPDLHKKEEGEDISSQMHKLHLHDNQTTMTETSNNLNSPVSLELFSGFPDFGSLSSQDSFHNYNLDGISEELLALEERIGTVRTALTEEAISKSLKTSIYQIKPCDHKEDAKCSICQEEYTIGDEVGRLHCEHTYHLKCVQEWLRMKSWCPICKTSADTSSSSK
uniref:RING-type E3 ubiquitin transferase n=1 Tax=Brassica campestris TaxID=3711 RepID=M4E5F5_BRACM